MDSVTDRYDPSETDERPRSGHVSKRDIIIVSVVLTVAIALLWPVVAGMLENRNKYVCKDNFGKISTALLIYAEENTGRLPPLFVEAPGGGPEKFEGRINSWVSLIAPLMSNPADKFRCPSAAEDELVKNEGPDGTTLLSSYGLFAGLAAIPIDSVSNQSQSAMMAETANQGAQGSYNPKPYPAPAGESLPDGIAIGFDNTNYPLDEDLNVLAKANFATRLAFYNVADGNFSKTGRTRHPSGIHVMFLDRHIETVKPTFAMLKKLGKSGEIMAPWSVPVLGSVRNQPGP